MSAGEIAIKTLSESNFEDFERLTAGGADGGCYCAFWHQKFSSMDEWKARQRDEPELNRQCMRERVRGHFHVGVLAYRGDDLIAWVSVSPLPEVYWAWRRVAQLGEAARDVAGITCITVAPSFRGEGLQTQLLTRLIVHGQANGWRAIEGYPFDPSAIEKHGPSLAWAGHAKGFEAAGYARVGAHWLSREGFERSVYRAELELAAR